MEDRSPEEYQRSLPVFGLSPQISLGTAITRSVRLGPAWANAGVPQVAFKPAASCLQTSSPVFLFRPTRASLSALAVTMSRCL